jgi:hypothetical protein
MRLLAVDLGLGRDCFVVRCDQENLRPPPQKVPNTVEIHHSPVSFATLGSGNPGIVNLRTLRLPTATVTLKLPHFRHKCTTAATQVTSRSLLNDFCGSSGTWKTKACVQDRNRCSENNRTRTGRTTVGRTEMAKQSPNLSNVWLRKFCYDLSHEWINTGVFWTGRFNYGFWSKNSGWGNNDKLPTVLWLIFLGVLTLNVL